MFSEKRLPKVHSALSNISKLYRQSRNVLNGYALEYVEPFLVFVVGISFVVFFFFLKKKKRERKKRRKLYNILITINILLVL